MQFRHLNHNGSTQKEKQQNLNFHQRKYFSPFLLLQVSVPKEWGFYSVRILFYKILIYQTVILRAE